MILVSSSADISRSAQLFRSFPISPKLANLCCKSVNDIFDTLEEFILLNKNRDVEALEFMNISVRKGIGKVITAKNYVGIIEIKDGTTIEILPKIYSQEDVTEAKVKKLVMDMLKTLRKSPYKSLQVANVSVDKMNIFEIFIRMFINEVLLIVKKGLKSNYETIESNERLFKGKMKFAQQIKYNYTKLYRFTFHGSIIS